MMVENGVGNQCGFPNEEVQPASDLSYICLEGRAGTRTGVVGEGATPVTAQVGNDVPTVSEMGIITGAGERT